MIPGCAPGARPAVEIAPAKDFTMFRCPAVSPEQRAILQRQVKPPPADQPFEAGAIRKKIDELRADNHAKSVIGLEIASELERCRTNGVQTSEAPWTTK
jgi:hypothetical protein